MILQYRTFSECGPRYKNEDAVGCVLIPEQQRAMFVLCDGMGGHRSGDIASQTVVKSLGNYWRRNPTCEDCNEKIIDACNEAKGTLEKCPQVEMGTTMVMVCLENGRALIAHCGDSRCYYFHTWGLQQLHTTDHCATTPEGWEYVYKGFVQGEETHIPEINEYVLTSGDYLLLCSDGLYKSFDNNEEIEQLLESITDIDELEATLMDRCKRYARDNYSAVIIKIVQI